jgi:hypothetical protein
MSPRGCCWQARAVNGAEGLLVVLGVVAGGSALVFLIVRFTDRW